MRPWLANQFCHSQSASPNFLEGQTAFIHPRLSNSRPEKPLAAHGCASSTLTGSACTDYICQQARVTCCALFVMGIGDCYYSPWIKNSQEVWAISLCWLSPHPVNTQPVATTNGIIWEEAALTPRGGEHQPAALAEHLEDSWLWLSRRSKRPNKFPLITTTCWLWVVLALFRLKSSFKTAYGNKKSDLPLGPKEQGGT